MMFVFDLDGTLLNSKKIISIRNKTALQKLSKRGYRIVVATARPPRSIDEKLRTLEIEHDTVYYNGAMIRFADGEISGYVIQNSILNEVHNFLYEKDNDAVLTIEEKDTWYTYKKYDFEKAFCVTEGPDNISEKNMLEKTPDKILINNYKNPREIKKIFGSKANVIETDSGSLIQIMAKEASKETAIKDIAEKYNIVKEDIYCFGDDHNDIGMFEYCGNSIAMGNAVQELKRMATFITSGNDEDGVAEFIENKILNNV
ncbi:MAG: HAD family hydrolase [Treponema sp.]|nr:HAD family hydrolase [Treponema sp.]